MLATPLTLQFLDKLRQRRAFAGEKREHKRCLLHGRGLSGVRVSGY
jgi:hypothetical protein